TRGEACSYARAHGGGGGCAAQAPADIRVPAAARPILCRRQDVDQGAPEVAGEPKARALLAVHQAQDRVARLETAIRAAVPDWSLAEVVAALMAMRGIDMVSATAFLAEIGDLTRFKPPRERMAYLGLVPSEHSTGGTVKRGPITKAGNRRARRTLVECAWSYRHPPRVGRKKQDKVAAAPRAVREIAWKAQTRLYARYRALLRRGKLKTVIVTAIARELAGFIWAIGREVVPAP